MALATKCPHCGTTFRVASDQLKLRGGIVRCGACQQVFDGNASLVDLDQLPAPSSPPSPEPQRHAATAPADTPVTDGDEVPVYTLDLEATLDPLGILPKPAGELEAHPSEPVPEPEPEPEPQPGLPPELDTSGAPELRVEPQAEPEPEPERAPAEHHRTVFSMGSALLDEPEPNVAPVVPELQAQGPNEPVEIDEPGAARIEPTLGVPVDEELVAAPPPDAREHADSDALAAEAEAVLRAAEAAPLPMRESADVHFAPPPPAPKSAKARTVARRSKLTPTRIAPPKLRVPDIDEPEFVKRGRQREQWGKRSTILMAAGSALLVLMLVLQGAYTFRNVLAARYPAMRPALAGVCSVLRCRVELPTQIDNLVIETGELQTLGPDTYQLSTLLRNQGSLVQAWPHIELALTDANDKPLLRRVFKPAEYLPHGVSPAAGFAARTEQPVRLYFQLDQLKPSGYHIAVFYP